MKYATFRYDTVEVENRLNSTWIEYHWNSVLRRDDKLYLATAFSERKS